MASFTISLKIICNLVDITQLIMTYIFLDTNIFLHFKFFIEIPWKDLVRDDFTIVVAPIVLDEIDKHKRHVNPKISKRAKQVLTKIDGIVSKNENYPLICLLNRPSLNTFNGHNLDRQEQDDSILATILEFRQTYPSNKICLISHDTGPRLRASSLSIKASDLSDTYLLVEEKSEEQKQIEKLKAENTLLKNTVPKMSLLFREEKPLLEWELVEYVVNADKYIEEYMTSERLRLPELIFDDHRATRKLIMKDPSGLKGSDLLNSPLFSSIGGMELSEQQVSDYNEELRKYLIKYEEYLGAKLVYKKRHGLSMPVDVVVHNTGNTPAIDIDIWMHFPDGFTMVSIDDYPKKPKPPKEPYKPKNRWDMPTFIPGIASMLPSPFPTSSMPDLNFNAPDIRKTNSYEVEYYRKSLKHLQSDKLDGLVVTFDSFESAAGFTIDYRLIVSNIPQPVTGQLNVKVHKKTKQE
jgi:hypothetical protein